MFEDKVELSGSVPATTDAHFGPNLVVAELEDRIVQVASRCTSVGWLSTRPRMNVIIFTCYLEHPLIQEVFYMMILECVFLISYLHGEEKEIILIFGAWYFIYFPLYSLRLSE